MKRVLVRKNSIRLPSDRDAGTYLFGFPRMVKKLVPVTALTKKLIALRPCIPLATGDLTASAEELLFAKKHIARAVLLTMR